MPKSKFGQDTRVILLLFLRSTLGFLDSQDQFNICTLVRHTATSRRHLVYDYLCNVHKITSTNQETDSLNVTGQPFSVLKCAIVLKTMFDATKKFDCVGQIVKIVQNAIAHSLYIPLIIVIIKQLCNFSPLHYSSNR